MSFEDVCKVLVNDPFWLRPSEIAQMTPWQVKHLYFCERKDNGSPVIGDGGYKPKTIKQIFYSHWAKAGLREDQIDKLWSEREKGG